VEQQIEEAPIRQRIGGEAKQVGAASAIRAAEPRCGTGGKGGQLSGQFAFQVGAAANRQARDIRRVHPG
jgi:hypothetical protein